MADSLLTNVERQISDKRCPSPLKIIYNWFSFLIFKLNAAFLDIKAYFLAYHHSTLPLRKSLWTDIFTFCFINCPVIWMRGVNNSLVQIRGNEFSVLMALPVVRLFSRTCCENLFCTDFITGDVEMFKQLLNHGALTRLPYIKIMALLNRL